MSHVSTLDNKEYRRKTWTHGWKLTSDMKKIEPLHKLIVDGVTRLLYGIVPLCSVNKHLTVDRTLLYLQQQL